MKRFQNILFVTSERNDVSVAKRAVLLAQHNDAKLTLLKVIDPLPDVKGYGYSDATVSDIEQRFFDSHNLELEELAQTCSPDQSIDTRIVEGRPAISVIKEVLKHGHDLVIKSVETHTGLKERLFGSIDMKLQRKCPCPVWIMRNSGEAAIKKIVAAIDFDDEGAGGVNAGLNALILELALSLAHRENAELHVLHAWQVLADHLSSPARAGLSEAEVEEQVDKAREACEQRIGKLLEQAESWVSGEIFEAVSPVILAERGRAIEVVPAQVNKLDADLLVMGTVGRVGLSGFVIGNTAETILSDIDCSVLALKPEGFVSPVTLT